MLLYNLRTEFVDMWIILNKSVEEVFEEFKRDFFSVRDRCLVETSGQKNPPMTQNDDDEDILQTKNTQSLFSGGVSVSSRPT